MAGNICKALIMARGLGSRMRRSDPVAVVDSEQARVADAGVKAMIPVGRPFLDYVLASLADAGFREVCLVIGPEHSLVKDYYRNRVKPSRLKIEFAVQERPLGTADAVAAAETFAGSDPFIVLNSDNLYPLQALEALRSMDGAGLAGFELRALVHKGNLSEQRVRRFPVLNVDGRGFLVDIVDPTAEDAEPQDSRVLVSMNCWRFNESIFPACRAISPSPNGEIELPVAVRHALRELGEPFRVYECHEGVLDLSTRGDIATVAGLLAGREVRL